MTTTLDNSLPGTTVCINGVALPPEAAQLVVDGLQRAVYAAQHTRQDSLLQHYPAFLTQAETLLRQTPGVSEVYRASTTRDFRYGGCGYCLRVFAVADNKIQLLPLAQHWPLADYVLPPTPDDDTRAQTLVAAVMTTLVADAGEYR